MKKLSELKAFKEKYPLTIAWRLRANYKVVQSHINKDEEIVYIFAAQKTNIWWDIFSTAVIVLTNKRILIGRKRVVFGYFYDSITLDMFNDLNIKAGLIWGTLYIDTVKELLKFKKIQKSALYELEDVFSEYLIKYNESHPEEVKNRRSEMMKKHKK